MNLKNQQMENSAKMDQNKDNGNHEGKPSDGQKDHENHDRKPSDEQKDHENKQIENSVKMDLSIQNGEISLNL